MHFLAIHPCPWFCNSSDSSIFVWLYKLHTGEKKSARANHWISFNNLKIHVEMPLTYLAF